MAAERLLCVVSLARLFLHDPAAPLFRMPVHLVVQVRVLACMPVHLRVLVIAVVCIVDARADWLGEVSDSSAYVDAS